MKHTLLVLGVLIQLVRTQIQTNPDYFKGDGTYDKIGAKIIQTRHDDSGGKFEQTVSLSKLELLSNDKLLLTDHKTCRETLKTFNGIFSFGTSAFQEIGQEAGFTHVHRDKPPQRGGCQFPLIIPSLKDDKAAIMENEQCMMEMFTGGTAVGDYDGDGLQDVFFTRYETRSVLYRNMGDGKYKDVTKSVNIGPDYLGSGAVWVDIDSDGDLDLYVTTVGDMRHYLYVNYGGYFHEEGVMRNASLKSSRKLSGMTPTFGDFDNDGYMDMYVSEWIFHYSTNNQVSASRLLKNMGAKNPGYFEDVTDSAGVSMDAYWKTFRNYMNSGTYTYGASFTDFDNDGWLDLFVIGDFGQSKMFWNNKNGTFMECTVECGINGTQDAKGLALVDINNDGLMDIFISSVYKQGSINSTGNALYLNKGSRQFEDIADQIGVLDGGWGWGSAFFDFDNDGYLDLISTNGFEGSSYAFKNMKLFHNQGAGNKNKMVDVAMVSGIDYKGLGRGLLVFDYDNDGDEDVIVAANVGTPKFFKNLNSNGNKWLTINAYHICLNNTYKVCASHGARVTLTRNNGSKQTSVIGSKSQFMGQSESAVHFGLGTYSGTMTVSVTWLRSGKSIHVTDVPVNQYLKVVEPQSMSETVSYSQLMECPRWEIKEIKTQPDKGKITINPDKVSVSYDTVGKSFFDLDIQTFQYVATIVPTSDSNNEVIEKVELNFRFTPSSVLFPQCSAEEAKAPSGNAKPEITVHNRIDGISNNIKNIHWGATKQYLLNHAPLAYGDNVSEPASSCTVDERMKKTCPFPEEFGGLGSHSPSPRLISNTLMAQTKDVPSFRNLSDFVTQFGQFISHDTDHTNELPRFEVQYHHNHVWMPINIPKGDLQFDPFSTGNEKMAFIRSAFDKCTGGHAGKVKRRQHNTVTSYIDANTVYGVSEARFRYLRSFQGGELKLDEHGYLPKNQPNLPNSNPTAQPSRKLYLAGDVRVNVQPGLAAQHTLWVREHNRLAKEYKMENPNAGEEEIFLKARRLLIAEMQHVTYYEYLPAVLGGQHIPPYKGYNESVDVGVATEFSTAAFRFGHSQVNNKIFRLNEKMQMSKYGHVLLRETYFRPNQIEDEGGLDPILRGSVAFAAQEVDLLMIDEMRNHLFPTKAPNDRKNTGFDLASLNIQRGRDHGVADLNTVRRSLGLKPYSFFYQITKNAEVVEKLKILYASVDNIDLWVGGLAEDHVHNSELGETFHLLMVEQFTRIRDGDRFWYQHNLTKKVRRMFDGGAYLRIYGLRKWVDFLTGTVTVPLEIQKVESTTMGKIIRLNTNYKDCPDNVFFSSYKCKSVRNHQCVPRSCRDADCQLEFENQKLTNKVDDQSRLVIILIIVAVVLACLCSFLIIGVVASKVVKKNKIGTISSTERPSQMQIQPVKTIFVEAKDVDTGEKTKRSFEELTSVTSLQ